MKSATELYVHVLLHILQRVHAISYSDNTCMSMERTLIKGDATCAHTCTYMYSNDILSIEHMNNQVRQAPKVRVHTKEVHVCITVHVHVYTC